MRNVPSLEAVERDFSQKGVQFFYIYKALAHPETNGYITPFSQRERLMHVAEAKRTLGSRIPWLCDNMENDLKHALGDRPNSEFVIDPDGRFVVSRGWSNPSQLRKDLEKLVGPVQKPTRVSDLDMQQLPPPEKAATGVVERLRLPGQMTPVKVRPHESPDVPHYAKLRAEMGGGKLYLGFFLDPLYKVHWNNQASPLEYSLNVPDELHIEPTSGKAPVVKVKADADPREFLLNFSGNTREPIELTVKYFACDDAETFCIPVEQKYSIILERDRDGGSRRSFGARGRPNFSRRGSGPRARQRPRAYGGDRRGNSFRRP